MAWVKPLGYEVNIDDTKDIIEALLNELVDPKAPYFGTYEELKARIELEIKLPQAVKRGRKKEEKMLKATKSYSSPLLITEGQGDDLGEEEGEEEESEEEEPPKKKGKVIITKLAKSSLAMFTRRAQQNPRRN